LTLSQYAKKEAIHFREDFGLGAGGVWHAGFCVRRRLVCPFWNIKTKAHHPFNVQNVVHVLRSANVPKARSGIRRSNIHGMKTLSGHADPCDHEHIMQFVKLGIGGAVNKTGVAHHADNICIIDELCGDLVLRSPDSIDHLRYYSVPGGR
jgi:hypothetical protein